jgi:hypothetical protein
VKTLLAQVLRRCDSILEALGDNGGDRGDVVRGVGGGINTVGTGGDAAWDSAGDDDVAVLRWRRARTSSWHRTPRVAYSQAQALAQTTAAHKAASSHQLTTASQAAEARSFCLGTEASNGLSAVRWPRAIGV